MNKRELKKILSDKFKSEPWFTSIGLVENGVMIYIKPGYKKEVSLLIEELGYDEDVCLKEIVGISARVK